MSSSTITFATTGKAKIFVGDYEARVTPIADTDPATELGSSAAFTPGTYDMVAVSPDRGFTRWTMTVLPGGGDRTETLGDVVNLASAAAGATVLGSTEGSLNPEALIDGTEATNWGGVTDAQVDESNPSVSVDLAGDVSTVKRVQVSAYLTPAPASPTDVPLAQDDPDSGSRFTALRQFALEACTAGCDAADATWTRFYTSPEDAFPSALPRPVAPTLNMRVFDVPDTQAAAVRLVTLENQCTGQEAYAGDQTASAASGLPSAVRPTARPGRTAARSSTPPSSRCSPRTPRSRRSPPLPAAAPGRAPARGPVQARGPAPGPAPGQPPAPARPPGPRRRASG